MKTIFKGEIISGNLDRDSKEFTITQIKSIPITTVRDIGQIRAMLFRLQKVTQMKLDTYVITLSDGISVTFDEKEIKKAYEEIKEILSYLELNKKYFQKIKT